MRIHNSEILINATLISTQPYIQLYEFVLNEDLFILECMQIHSLITNQIAPVENFRALLSDRLFELNHVRINPYIDNTYIINKLGDTLKEIGVEIKHTPHLNDIAQCYKPLGEIMQNVRFHFNESGRCTFLCPNAKLRLIKSLPVQHLPRNHPL